MPPPAVPDPQWLKTPEAKEYARKALAAVEKKDEEAVRTLTNQVRKKMTQAIQKGAGLMDNDYGMIMGSLENAQSGGWEQAEKNLRDLLTYSEDQEKKSQ